MDLSIQDWGAIGEIVGGLAVVLTLLYLGIQLRQSGTGMQASAYQQWVGTHTQVLSVFWDKDNWAMMLPGWDDARNLDKSTYGPFMIWCRQYFLMQQAQYHLYRSGVIDGAIWQSNLEDMLAFYRFPGIREWWDAGGKTTFTPDFISVVEESEGHATMIAWSEDRGFYPSPHHA